MRRLPVFLLVDVSESMAGESIDALRGGMQQLMLALRKDPMVIEIGALSVISFGCKAKVEVPLSSVLDVSLPRLRLSSGTSLGAAFELLDREIDAHVTKTTEEVRGDYKPIVFVVTDGQPTDEWESAFGRFKKRHPRIAMHAIGCGEDVDFSVLKKMTESVYKMKDMDSGAFGKLFKCVSASICSATASQINGDAAHEDLTEWAGDAIQKPTDSECRPILSQTLVMIPAICSSERAPYLLRYRLGRDERYECVAAHRLEGELEGGTSKAGEVAASRLGIPMSCPYCGNAALVHCGNCGTLSCIRPTAESMTCPKCGEHGRLSCSQDFTVDRSRG